MKVKLIKSCRDCNNKLLQPKDYYLGQYICLEAHEYFNDVGIIQDFCPLMDLEDAIKELKKPKKISKVNRFKDL